MAQSARDVEPMKQIAVVIPLYNHAAYIGDAIRSVLAQTRTVDKIVIVDDGSTDDSVEIVRAFAEPRIELSTQPNAGAHAAINRGISRSPIAIGHRSRASAVGLCQPFAKQLIEKIRSNFVAHRPGQ